MSSNDELLQKVVDTTLLGSGGGGLLTAEQADRFIDYMVDASVLVKEVRLVRMNAPTRDIDKIGLGTRITKKATENVDDHNDTDPVFSKISLITTKLRLDWRLTTESLEDNIEGDSLEDTVARLMATQLGNDLEDLYINGDVTSVDPLLMSFDGWHKLSLNSAHVVANALDSSSHHLWKGSFNAGLKAMPNKYLQRRVDLRFYSGSNALQDFLNGLTDRTTPLGDAVIFGGPPGGSPNGGGMTNIRPFGIPVVEVPLQLETISGTYSGATSNHGYLDLTFPKNRIVGVQRDVRVYREFKPKADAIEYTVFTRVCVATENEDAWVVVKDIKLD